MRQPDRGLRMRFTRHAREEPEINLIPFIDVLLVILIFLMLTTTYSQVHGAAGHAADLRRRQAPGAAERDHRGRVRGRALRREPQGGRGTQRRAARGGTHRRLAGVGRGDGDRFGRRDRGAPGGHQRARRGAQGRLAAPDLRHPDRQLTAVFSSPLQASWWRPAPDALANGLRPLSWLYAWLVQRRRRQPGQRVGLPVVVVGNLVVGGAGKTPTVIALVRLLRDAGWTPGIVSRGYRRREDALLDVTPQTDAAACGDEPLLIRLRTAAPVVVGRERVARHPPAARTPSRRERGRQRRRAPALGAAPRRAGDRVRRPRHRQRPAAAGRSAARADARVAAGGHSRALQRGVGHHAAARLDSPARAGRRAAAGGLVVGRRTAAAGRAARTAAARRGRDRRAGAVLRHAGGGRALASPAARCPTTTGSTSCRGARTRPTWCSPRRTP